MKQTVIATLLATAFAVAAPSAIAAEGGKKKLTQEQIDKVVQSQPMPTGKMLADNCSACHGTLGAEFNEAMPPLAGMKKENFIKLMKAFRANAFPTIVMHDVAYVFTDTEIEAMADYFAAQKAEEWTRPDFKGEGK
ncbi:c-type cytochrome [Thiomicrorhabdus heinhorstiae]|uniref:C-type cytochrome n=1 Tax=Thiomicrorhabdus heinhorstiae TaxID=2748010 RepID=A0ABS0BX10_9GAMM|nr:c-type cytochrome [Thiomicrorhabdus heinhorstiae]MBF6057366.1 c-type cytochrome [Thiomicrorhabdus heinhorstiae]